MQEHPTLPRGSRLPHIQLTAVPDDCQAPLVAGRGPMLVLAVHLPLCDECLGYAQELAEASGRFSEWGGRLMVVVRGPVAAARALAAELPRSTRVLADPHARLPAWGSSLIVADEWGEVFFAVAVDERHELPTVDELVDWTRYVAIQCEECEMPEGGWKELGPAA